LAFWPVNPVQPPSEPNRGFYVRTERRCRIIFSFRSNPLYAAWKCFQIFRVCGGRSKYGKTLVIKGEITGSESIRIEGKVEGSITLSHDRVTVGRNGRVAANIAAQDIVVLGEVLGNCDASDHLDIRCEGSLCGDVVVSRISVEEGAYLTGSIDIRKKPAHGPKAEEQELVESLHVN
jgi:cytoskeletal protein CcmA (bactofilin family)